MADFFHKLFDSKNSEVEAHLVVLVLGTMVFVMLAIYHVVFLHHDFVPDQYGQGLGTLLAGGGAAAWGQGLQRKSENDKTDIP